MNLPTLTNHDDVPMADSREVAATFGKKHFHVLEAYRNLQCSAEFRQSNFRAFKIKDLTGESLSHVLMTKNGFAFLVLGFTGAAAAVFKEAYIERFDAMERELRKGYAPAVPQTLPEALRLAADLADRVAEQDRAIAVLEPRSEALATIADNDGTFCLRDAAALLQITETDFLARLREDSWIYRREAGGAWTAHAERRAQGWMTMKVVPVDVGNGKVWNKPQARITSAGLTILAVRLGRPVPSETKMIAHAASPQGSN